MSATAPKPVSPLGEPQVSIRRKRLARLALMVFELMRERYLGGRVVEFDSQEEAGLIDALRVCSSFTSQIGCLDFDDLFVIQIEGIDGHVYIIQFSLLGTGFAVHAARASVLKLKILADHPGQMGGQYNTLNVLEDHSARFKLGRATTDQAFLLGMANVIRLMEHPDDEDDEGLTPLIEWIAPRREELRRIQAELPPSPINDDGEGDLPY